ncbi:hypothetical protein OEZ85_012179 [Tetradesmus obliquus]|uniref:Uncharacterized protein n=1 Tax=Tetradesmus obliquus TaxID=3088 RepID=A0ABY8TSP2_TETOB|nr:hypothetical protein OEZ85_012179 [Tetradesmus obliquus]
MKYFPKGTVRSKGATLEKAAGFLLKRHNDQLKMTVRTEGDIKLLHVSVTPYLGGNVYEGARALDMYWRMTSKGRISEILKTDETKKWLRELEEH